MNKVMCEVDGKEFSNGGVLARYLKKVYDLDYKNYYHKYVLKTDIIPKCKCGCGEETNWSGMKYRDYKKSHHIRVKNPWGHNPQALQKSLETRRQRFKEGKIKVWCKGLSTKTDDRLKGYGKKISKKFTTERKEEYSKKMKKMRLDGTIPTLYGKQHSRWNGGASRLRDMIYSNKRLYDEWKYPILIRDGFKCVECPNSKNLHIHHDKETMCDIVKKHCLDDIDMNDFELKKSIAEKIVEYHIQNKVSGVTLCNECHNKLHPSLNFV